LRREADAASLKALYYALQGFTENLQRRRSLDRDSKQKPLECK